MLDSLKQKFKGITNKTKDKTEDNKQITESNQNKDYVHLEEVNMRNYVMSERVAKKVAPLNNLWTYSMDSDSNWNNELYYTRENAIARGSAHAKQMGLNKFYIAKSIQNGLPLGTNALSILFQIKDSIMQSTQGQRSDYLNKVTEKDVYELEDNLQMVVHEWLEKNNFKENFYMLDLESIQEVNVNAVNFT